MLSYRHAFHAANHADVLKHFVLTLTLDYFNQKDKPYWYIDTHAGAGQYDLNSEYAQKTTEYLTGFHLLQQHYQELPSTLKHFVDLIEQTQQNNASYYPGSPKIADHLVRKTDSLRLFELHPTDSVFLIDAFRSAGRRVQIKVEDGFEGVIRILPPAPRRSVILIDPPYEEKTDYIKVVQTLKKAIERFATGCYLLWYPCLSRVESKKLPEQLKKIVPNHYLNTQLIVQEESQDGFGMFGSGMFVINPPFLLKQQLQESLPVLVKLLKQDNKARFVLDAQIR
ncbi:23S rRNA (adenine(2030)-N(6))-methyltransferase RlmJ [Neisseria sp. Ec49-e6-T10]|uniref:23S rRNA (adenine(2030)-N(6))-methyltransferase RlmJ n=1 Tax=Neisseria sp. Ec49-e6-T10 TaxID=3140744 RepID=UPI003EBE8962